METADRHKRFVTWAKRRGVVINGIETAQIPGQGVGVIASRDIKVIRIAKESYIMLPITHIPGR